MRGVKSFAMVLCVRDKLLHLAFFNVITIKATHKDGKDAGIELVRPPPGAKPGDRVYFEGDKFESELVSIYLVISDAHILLGATPLSQLNPKKKIFETIQPGKQ